MLRTLYFCVFKNTFFSVLNLFLRDSLFSIECLFDLWLHTHTHISPSMDLYGMHSACTRAERQMSPETLLLRTVYFSPQFSKDFFTPTQYLFLDIFSLAILSLSATVTKCMSYASIRNPDVFFYCSIRIFTALT